MYILRIQQTSFLHNDSILSDLQPNDRVLFNDTLQALNNKKLTSTVSSSINTTIIDLQYALNMSVVITFKYPWTIKTIQVVYIKP